MNEDAQTTVESTDIQNPAIEPIQDGIQATIESPAIPTPVEDQNRWRELVEIQSKVIDQLSNVGGQKPVEKPQEPQPQAVTKPDPTQYQYGVLDENYQLDLARFVTAETLQKQYEASQRMAAQQTEQQKIQSLLEKEKEYSKVNPTYNAARQAVLSNPDLADNRAIYEAVIDSDVPTEIINYLGTHMDEALEIAKLNPTRAAMRLGAIEDKLKASKQSKPVSNAPAPINPISGTGATVNTVDLATVTDYETYKRARQSKAA